MPRSLRTPQCIYTVTVALWAAGMAIHCAWFIHQALAGPPSPDLYANHLSFVLVVFLFFRVPVWLVGLLLMLVGEFVLFGRKRALPDADGACS